MGSLVSKKDVWYAVFSLHHHQKWIRLGRGSKTLAKKALRKLEEEFEEDQFNIFQQEDVTFSELSKEYLEYSKTNKALNSYNRDITSLKHLNPEFRNIMVRRITPKLIEQYKTKRTEEKAAPRTVNLELRCLSNMFTKAIEWNYMKTSPFNKVKLIKFKKKPPRFLSKDEIPRFYEAACPRITLIAKVLINTGLRDEELRTLKLANIDFTNRRIVVEASKTDDYRVIPLNQEAYETFQILKEYFISPQDKKRRLQKRQEQHQKYVFCDNDGAPIKKLTHSITHFAKKAGLENVSPHTFRHTFASHLIMNNVDLRTVQKLLGHKDIQTTMIYAHLTEDHLARGVEKLNWS